MFSASISKILLWLCVCFLEIKLGSLQLAVPSTETEKHLRAITKDIELQRYALAQEQMVKLENKNDITQIIHEFYQNNNDSVFDAFDAVMYFEKALTRVDIAFYVLRGLRAEMVANGDRDPLKLIPLAKAFQDDVVFQKNNDKIIKAESERIIRDIKGEVKDSATETLTAAMLSSNYFQNNKAENVARAIFKFYYDLNDEIMRQMVNRTYKILPAIDIVDTIMLSSEFIPQKVSVFLAVFEKLEKDKSLNNEAVLQIASYIKQLREQDNYVNLFHNQKYEVNVMIDRMPACARNLYFVDEFCIWNRGRSEYLFAGNSQNYSSARSVYTCAPGALKTGEGTWIIEPSFGNLLFKSQSYKKEYLAVSKRKFNGMARNVQTRERVEIYDDDLNSWNVELSGEYCFIKNVNFNEYIFASDRLHYERERYVLSASASSDIDVVDFQWQIRDCS